MTITWHVEVCYQKHKSSITYRIWELITKWFQPFQNTNKRYGYVSTKIKPLILILPSTLQQSMPNVFLDSVERDMESGVCRQRVGEGYTRHGELLLERRGKIVKILIIVNWQKGSKESIT